MINIKKKSVALIVGGSGQFGISLGNYLLKKNFEVNITSRNKDKIKHKLNKNIFIHNLNIYKLKSIEKIIKKINPNYIFYFAGQSSPAKSFYKKKETYLSNVVGCKNFLLILKKNKIFCKFINATSCEMYGDIKGKIKVNSIKKPYSPYGYSKAKSFNITKKYREKYKLKSYNAIIFNSESFLRPKNYLIPKICFAALNAKKNNIKTKFGNLSISREWNWCDEQSKYLFEFAKKKPQDFILSNGKSFTAIQMIKFAFEYLNLDYKKFILSDRVFFRKKDVIRKASDYKICLQRNNIKRNDKVYGKFLIRRIIKYYINNKIL